MYVSVDMLEEAVQQHLVVSDIHIGFQRAMHLHRMRRPRFFRAQLQSADNNDVYLGVAKPVYLEFGSGMGLPTAHNQYVQRRGDEACQAAALRTRNKLTLSTNIASFKTCQFVNHVWRLCTVGAEQDGTAFTVVRQRKEQDDGRDTRTFAKTKTRMPGQNASQ
jgi:hypothetical protein